MKIGIDIHGVINERPDFFQKLTRAIIESGGEVHILSGPPEEQIERELKELGLRPAYNTLESPDSKTGNYSAIFSIVDYHKELGTPMIQDSKGNWHLHIPDQPVGYSHSLWDRAKGDYCFKHQLDMLIDDSDTYDYFIKSPTSYARFKSKTKRTWHVNVDEIINASK